MKAYTNGQARVEVPMTAPAGFFRLSEADGSEECVITIVPDPVCVNAGQMVEVTAAAMPVLGGNYSWSVGAAKVAKITRTHGVRGNKVTLEGANTGTTTLTVTYALPNPPGGTCSASVEVTVK